MHILRQDMAAVSHRGNRNFTADSDNARGRRKASGNPSADKKMRAWRNCKNSDIQGKAGARRQDERRIR